MAELIFRPLTAGDIDAVAADLCAGERMTMRDVYGAITPQFYLTDSIMRSGIVHAGELAGRPVCVFGVVPVSLLGGTGWVWFMTTEALLRHPITLVKGVRRHVQRLHETFPRLIGKIDSRHTSTMRWMRMLGGVIGGPVAGPNGVQFCDFVKEI